MRRGRGGRISAEVLENSLYFWTLAYYKNEHGLVVLWLLEGVVLQEGACSRNIIDSHVFYVIYV